MSAVCENFVQNTWKKDLCSNCFKLKQDHRFHVCSTTPTMDIFNERYTQNGNAVYHSQQSPMSTTWKGLALQKHFGNNGYLVNNVALINDENNYGRIKICNNNSASDNSSDEEKIDNIPIGILKSGQRKASTGSVGFCDEDPQVIGFGGELEFEKTDVDSAEEESDDCDDCDSLENFDASEDEKEFSLLTERNTEFNSVHSNLLVVAAEEEANHAKNSSSLVQEVKVKPVEEEKTSANGFQLPRAAIRPFCRESVSSILDSKVNAATPEVHYDEHGHVVIIEMSAANSVKRDKECVAYEVSPLANVVAADFNLRSRDSPPELPTNPPPNQNEQPLGRVDSFTKSNLVSVKLKSASLMVNDEDPVVIPQPDYGVPEKTDGEMHYSSSAILKGLPQSPQISNHYSCTAVSDGSTKVTVSPSLVKIKPKVPLKPKLSPQLSIEREYKIINNNDSDSSSQSTSEEIYQDTSEEQTETTFPEDKGDLTFQDKVANLNSNLDFNRKSTKRPAPQPPPQPLPIDEKSPSIPFSNETSPGNQLAVLLRHPPNCTSSRKDGLEDREQQEREMSTTSPTPPKKPQSPVVVKKNSIFSSNTKVRTCHSLDISSSKFLSTPTSEESKDNRKFKGKFSFKKFLKFGKDGEDGSRSKTSPYSSSTLDKRLKLEIIHPMDLANSPPSAPSPDWEPELTSYEMKLDSGSTHDHTQSWATRIKPPPPPRVKNGDQVIQKESGCKPMRPPPPSKMSNYNAENNASPVQMLPLQQEKIDAKSDDVRIVQDGSPSGGGDVRIILAPKKPERNSPGCTRKDNCDVAYTKDENKTTYSEPDNSPEDEKSDMSTVCAQSPVNKISRHSRQAKAAGMVFMDSGFGEHSSGDSDVASVSSGDVQQQNPSPSRPDLSSLYAEVIRKAKKATKQRQIIPTDQQRDSPPPLPPHVQQAECSSTDSDNTPSDSSVEFINQPTTVEVKLNTLKCSTSTPLIGRKNLSLHPNRCVIHRNLEENYAAIVTANHEALAQLVEQVSNDGCADTYSILKDAPLRWSNFQVNSSPVTTVQNIAFFAATWESSLEVTLMVSEDIFPIPIPAKVPFLLRPLATFQDVIPSNFLNATNEQIPRMIWVFPHTKIQTLPEFSQNLKSIAEEDVELYANVICFLTFQLISVLKHLQSQGTEEVGYPPSWLVVIGNEQNYTNLRLSLLGGTMQTFPHPDADCYSLCKSALLVMELLLNGKDDLSQQSNIFQYIPDNFSRKNILQVVIEELEKEKTSSLSRVKCILEYSLFGPTELALDGCGSCKEQEAGLQRWLDLEKATVLNTMIRLKNLLNSEMSVFEEYHVSFLIQANARNLNEAANLVRRTLATSVA